MNWTVLFLDAYSQFILDNSRRLLRLSIEHIRLTFLSLAIALPIAVTFGVFISYYERAAKPVLWVASVLLTVPALAFFGLLVPVLGIGNPPTIAVLVAYAQLPVIRNTYIGLTRVDDAAVEAGAGLGMTRFERLWRVRVPVALPVVMAGIRNTAVLVVGLVTIAAFIGGGGLGHYVFYGITTANTVMIVVAAVAISVLALAYDYVFGVAEEGLRLRNGEDIDPTLVTRTLTAVRTRLQ
jgi:osmoprotectant transport system permease protein